MAGSKKGVLAAGLVLMVAGGCSSDGKSPGPVYRCGAVDASGGVYISENLDKVAAADQALQLCSSGAADPTTCRAGSCSSQW